MQWIEYNNKVLSGEKINPEYDVLALKSYFEDNINPNTVFFHDVEEKIEYMTSKGYWDKDVISKFSLEEVKLVFKKAYSYKFRFESFMGAYKFYTDYALQTPDKKRWLERYEDRMSITALTHTNNIEDALEMVDYLIHQRFVPATPTLMNSGRGNAGRLVSCFLLSTMTDNSPSINRTLDFVANLSSGGGGIGVLCDDIRAAGEPMRGIENVTKGVVGVAKLLDNQLRYFNQAGMRLGAGAIYLSVLHPDFMDVMSAKKPAVDEDKRLKTLSIGVKIPDIVYQKAKNDEDVYQFYPYSLFQETGRVFSDIDWTKEYEVLAENPNIRKTRISARKILEEIAITQAESGYPYILNIDTANAANPIPNVATIKMSNLC